MVSLHEERRRSQGRQCWGPTPPGPHLPTAPTSARPRELLGSTRDARSKVRHGHRPRSSRSQGEAGAGPARAGPGVPGSLRGGDQGVKGAQVARSLVRCWGRPPRRAARQGPAPAAAGRARAALSLRPPSFPPAGRQRRFPLGETTRILPGAPRPAPLLRPLPFAGEPGLACAGKRLWQPEPGGGGGPRSRRPTTRPAM